MAAEGGASRGASRANVIWVFGNQHRPQALSCAGDDFALPEA